MDYGRLGPGSISMNASWFPLRLLRKQTLLAQEVAAMPPKALGTGTLKRLSQLPTAGRPVLSVYLDLDGDDNDGLRSDPQLTDLLDGAVPEDAKVDVAGVQDLLRTSPALRREAHGLAIFSSAAAGVLEAVQLPIPFEPMAVLDTLPWLEPLAGLVTRDNWGVAVMSPRRARLFLGGPHGVNEFLALDCKLGDRQNQRVARPSFADGLEPALITHVRGAADRLMRAHRRRAFTRLVIIARPELRAVIEASLDERLKEVQVGIVARDLDEASPVELSRAAAPMIEGAERARERALLVALDRSLEIRGAAVEGVDGVLTALKQRRVEVLLVADGSSLIVGLCPRCGGFSTSSGSSSRHGPLPFRTIGRLRPTYRGCVSD